MTEPNSRAPRVAEPHIAEPHIAEPAWLPSDEDSARQKRFNKLASNPSVITGIWIVSAILNVLFLGSIVILALLYTSNTTTLHNSSVSQCQANNIDRKQDIAIWNLLTEPTPQKLSPAETAKFDELKQLVKIKDTPRDCVKVYAP